MNVKFRTFTHLLQHELFLFKLLAESFDGTQGLPLVLQHVFVDDARSLVGTAFLLHPPLVRCEAGLDSNVFVRHFV